MRNRLMISLVLAASGTATAQNAPGLEPRATDTGAIVGRVVEAGTDTPVANARVWLRQTRGEIRPGVLTRSENLTTDSSGAMTAVFVRCAGCGLRRSGRGTVGFTPCMG